MSGIVHVGDCIAVMAAMPEDSVDAVVCDPPYELGFMGKAWDASGIAFQPETWAAALRVLKPGGHLLAFGGTRTYHRIACAIEDAGFEVRDTIAWMYGSGFPKSLDVSKAIDKAAGAERKVVGRYVSPEGTTGDSDGNAGIYGAYDGGALSAITAPATPDAERWQGWGTALKPAYEPIIVARRPLMGTVAANVLAHGTGALNVDGCRIEYVTVEGGTLAQNTHLREGVKGQRDAWFKPGDGERVTVPEASGRWPANVILDSDAAAMLDEQTGELTSGDLKPYKRTTEHAHDQAQGARTRTMTREGDSGGASRFFYCAKADSAERHAGLGNDMGLFSPADAPDRNDHPTVKPIDLMRWLIRLVTPPGGTVLDPFTGSGTTGCGAALEGFDFIGIEREDAYATIARARLAHWSLGQAA